MRKSSLAIAALLLSLSNAASAQDYLSWGSSYATNVGVNGAAERSARSTARRGAPAVRTRSAAQAQACAGRGRFRAQYGAQHPKVRQLEALCARAGL